MPSKCLVHVSKVIKLVKIIYIIQFYLFFKISLLNIPEVSFEMGTRMIALQLLGGSLGVHCAHWRVISQEY